MTPRTVSNATPHDVHPLNELKKLLFRAYCIYERHMPLDHGKFFLARWLYKLFGLAAFTIDGFTIELNPFAAQDRTLISGGRHDAVVSDELDTLQEGDAFIDVGANIGYFSLYAAARGIETFAFEPSPREIQRMRRNLALNTLRAPVTLFEQGLSDKPETLSLRLGMDYNPGQNSVLDVEKAVGVVDCHFAPLSTFLTPAQLERVRLCKIDVEGFELSVLRGMETCMPHLSQAVFVVEISPRYFERAGYTSQDIYDFFEKYGYTARYQRMPGAKRYDEVFTPSH